MVVKGFRGAMAASGLKVASLRRRAAAGAIDAIVLGIPVLGISIGGAALYSAYLRRSGRELDPARMRDALRLAGPIVSAAAAVPTRNSRSPGSRIMGLHRVDGRTGGPVSVRSALIRAGFSAGVRHLSSRRQPRVSDERPASLQACGRAVLILVALEGPALLPPRHQSLPDWLAGIVVVED
jgi:hypothetical protein